MPANIQSLRSHLGDLRDLYEAALADGSSGTVIRTGRVINHLHDYVVEELKARGIPESWIFRERQIKGLIKPKSQDIIVFKGKQPILSINVRSQLSSIGKNQDTLFERLIGEAVNLRAGNPNLVMGYLYLLPSIGYVVKPTEKRQAEVVSWPMLIDWFNHLAAATPTTPRNYQYERICLLGVDFGYRNPNREKPNLLLTGDDFVAAKLLTREQTLKVNYAVRLSVTTFFDDLVAETRRRFRF